MTRPTTASRAQRVASSWWRRMSSARRALPDFLIVGAQRSGTTSTYDYLAAHPGVRPAKRKEVHYFGVGENYARGPAWYRAWFPVDDRVQTGDRWITGEASPYYLFHPCVPERAADLLPDARLIAILRDPTDRAMSAYHHAVRGSWETRSLETAIADELAQAADRPPCRDFDAVGGPLRRHAYLARGRYAEQLARWFTHFPREHVLVLDTASVIDPAGAGRAALCRFLGLEVADAPGRFAWNNRQHYDAPDPAIRRRLDDHFRPYNEELWTLLGERWHWGSR
jgi:Sulfotransferase domain